MEQCALRSVYLSPGRNNVVIEKHIDSTDSTPNVMNVYRRRGNRARMLQMEGRRFDEYCVRAYSRERRIPLHSVTGGEREAFLMAWKTLLQDVVPGTPPEECLGADAVVADGERPAARLRALHKVAVHVALAEALQRDLLPFGPAGEQPELDGIIADGFFGAGGLEVQEEVPKGLLPGGNGQSGNHLCPSLFPVGPGVTRICQQRQQR
jgi:hypothetical protein